MIVERVKYIIWAADMDRAARFYTHVLGGTVLRQNPHICEIQIAGGIIGIHGGGEGTRTWTGLSFQVPDVVAGAPRLWPPAASWSENPSLRTMNRPTSPCAWTRRGMKSC
ncbi:VOC family protein [Verrucomicrobium spinosum]|uniref:VOC family protein n=1 Tax=Verrucomicrobium spinosum TaxID=2736 RepID=UPI0009463EEF|nr:VOC family protein [Verrucomicrobium spinosum]